MTHPPYTGKTDGGSRVVSLAAARGAREAASVQAQEEAFRRYVEASQRAQRTLSFMDGIEAGRAWGNFIALFVRAS